MNELQEVHEKDKRPYELRRETSQYNKYMKWRVIFYYSIGGTILASDYFRTRREAEYRIERMIRQGKEGFPIGNKIIYSDYICVAQAI